MPILEVVPVLDDCPRPAIQVRKKWVRWPLARTLTCSWAFFFRIVFYIMGSSGMCNLERRGCMVSYTNMIQEGGETYLVPSNKYMFDAANWCGIGLRGTRRTHGPNTRTIGRVA
jgi:hypothetical protein